MTKLTLLLVLATAIAVGSASTPGAASADGGTPSVYTDAAGDAKTAPDITKATLTPGNGTVTVDITYTGALGADGSLLVAFDTDRNHQTGNRGFEYLAYADGENLSFEKWDGVDWAQFPHAPTSPSLSSTDLTFTVTLADIGATVFDFVAGSVRGDDVDGLPDDGIATYPAPAETPPAPTVKAILLPGVLFTAKAGKVLRVPKLRVLLSDGSIAAVDRQTCALTLRGKAVRALPGGCAWKLPPSYARKQLMLTLTIRYADETRQAKWPVIPR